MMLIKFILAIVVLTIIISKPILLFLCAGFGLAWLLLKRPNLFASLLDKAVKEPKKERSMPKKDFVTYEERQEKEMSKIKFKDPDKTDPKWQALNKKVRDHNAKMSGMAVKENRLEALTSEVV
jgi:hypothetical protein